jgi:hypothetical protein
MVTHVFMTTDEEFINVTRLVASFCLETQTPFWKNIGEVAATLQSPNYLTLLMKEEGERVVGYVSGYFMSPQEFMVSQAYHRKGEGNVEAFALLEEELRGRGCTKIIGLALPALTGVFDKYGLKLERLLLSKYL